MQLSWAGGFDMNDSNDFMRKISKNILRVNLFSTLKFSFLGLFLALLGNLVLSDIAFKYFLAGLLSLTFSLPLINLIVNFKKFWFPEKISKSHSHTSSRIYISHFNISGYFNAIFTKNNRSPGIFSNF
ncbi:hypothetical protein [Halpernia sp. GG3]